MEDRNGAARVFIEKDGERKEVQVEKRVEGGRARVWLAEKTPNHPRVVEVGDDQPIQESEDGGMQEDTPEEKHAIEVTGLVERIAFSRGRTAN